MYSFPLECRKEGVCDKSLRTTAWKASKYTCAVEIEMILLTTRVSYSLVVRALIC